MLIYIFKSLHKVSNHPATILFRCSITKQDKTIWVIPQEFVAMKNVATKNLIDYDISITQLLDKIEEHIENSIDIKNLNIKRELKNLLKIMPAEFAGIDKLSINNYDNLAMRNQSSFDQSIILDIYDDLINTSQVIHYYSSLFAIFNKQQNYEIGLSYVNFNQSKKVLNERIANIKIQYKTDYKNHLQSLVAVNTKDNTPMKLLAKDMSATENHNQLVEQNLDLVDSAPGYAQQQENISTIFYPTKDLQNAITSATTTKAKAQLVDEYEKQAQEDIRQSNMYLQNNLQLKSKQILTELLEIDDLEDPECIKSKCDNLEALETSIIGSIMQKYIITHALCTSCSIIIKQTYDDKDSEFLNNMDEILNNGKLLNHENLHKFNSAANKYLKNIKIVEQSMKVAIEYFNELIDKAKKYELPAIYLLENIINIQHILKECADNFFKMNELLQKIHDMHLTKGRLITQIRNKNNGNHSRKNSERFVNIKLKQKSFFNSLKDVVANKDTTFFTFINNINASLLEIDAVISN